jgi:CBS domain-containing protein
MENIDLDGLTVQDVMVRDVITVAADVPVADLIRLFDYAQISGAPVLDVKGRLVGVVSIRDVMRLAAHAREIAAGDTAAPYRFARTEDELMTWFADPDERAAPPIDLTSVDSVFEEFTVRDIMTTATFTVRAEASLSELARFLARGRIHRSLVLDGDRLAGIVTTFDLVRAVAGEITPVTPVA